MTSYSVDTKPGDEYFQELANTKISFPASICELVDNSISAASRSSKCAFHIVIRIVAKTPEALEIAIVDDGTGMIRSDLINEVFRPAGRVKAHAQCYGGLREHGFGLKHALAWLTHLTGFQFTLTTAARAGGNPVEYTQVDGPLRIPLSAHDVSHAEWGTALAPFGFGRTPPTGTVISFSCKLSQAASGWIEPFQHPPRLIDGVESLVRVLAEQLGVAYRRFLSVRGRPSTITILWEDPAGPKSGRISVVRVQIPFLPGSRTDSWKVSGALSVRYTRGIMDPDSPLRLFYKHREPLQGIDVVYNGKVVQTAWYPWTGSRNNEQNGFVGELLISAGKAPTLLTKNELNWADPHLNRLRSQVVHLDRTRSGTSLAVPYKRLLESTVAELARRRYRVGTDSGVVLLLREFARKQVLDRVSVESAVRSGHITSPIGRFLRRVDKSVGNKLYLASPPVTHRVSPTELGEVPLRNSLFSILHTNHATLNPAKEHRAWDPRRTGSLEVPSDLVIEVAGATVVFECKVGEAKPAHVLQLLLNMEGFSTPYAESGVAKRPETVVGILVADAFPADVRFLRDYLAKRPAHPRHLKFVLWKTTGVSRTSVAIPRRAITAVRDLVTKEIPRFVAGSGAASPAPTS